MAGTAKEEDLRPISDRKYQAAMRRSFLEDLRDFGGKYGAIESKMYASCLEHEDFEKKCGNLEFNKGKTGSQ